MMSRPPNKPHRCGACGESSISGTGHNARTCATRLPEGKRRCSCGDVYTATTTKQTQCLPCRRLTQKLRAIKLEEESAA